MAKSLKKRKLRKRKGKGKGTKRKAPKSSSSSPSSSKSKPQSNSFDSPEGGYELSRRRLWSPEQAPGAPVQNRQHAHLPGNHSVIPLTFSPKSKKNN
tara:strand:- start:451 stop:741 length:291 start_codon:yes stop_codon:yes gene_type:complete